MEKEWALNAKALFDILKSSENGLTTEEAEKRLQKFGNNEIKKERKFSPIKLFLSQFTNLLVIILIIACIISSLIGHIVDALVILAILIVNAIFGFVQEYKAEKAIEALQKLTAVHTNVIRNKKIEKIDIKYVVPGDIVILEEGDKVPADCRIINSTYLQVDESMLTGESFPIEKIESVLPEKTRVADRTNMVYGGTIVTRGRGKGIVTDTAMETELGKIAKSIQQKEKKTPMQIYLDKFSKKLSYMVLAVVVLVFLVGAFQNLNLIDVSLTAISLAVAAIPEGLPAVVTLSFAIAVKGMVKKNALVRRLPSVETLGSTDVICTDKTGTLTENKMNVLQVYADEELSNPKDSKSNLLFLCGLLCNNSEENRGDPTESALISSAIKNGFNVENENKKYKRILEIPFNSKTKRMSVVVEKDGKKYVFTKGAPDVIMPLCNRILKKNKTHLLSVKEKREIISVNNKMADDALRVLGFAYKEIKSSRENPEENLVFIGLQGMIDPPRPEVKKAVEECQSAGIKIIMSTGDHALTAKAIAKAIGFRDLQTITGEELAKISDEELRKKIKTVSIFARMDPDQKIRLIKAAKSVGYIVAATGDGVNDAPAIKTADIGVAMGIRGTEVTKEAADIVLTDDNFATIVTAVKEGRRIFDNVKKFINYLLTCNFAEVMVIFLASMFGYLAMLPVQILWINLLTDGLPALALGIDPARPGIMNGKTEYKKKALLDKKMTALILGIGGKKTILLLAMFFVGLWQFGIQTAQTMLFTGFVIYELLRIAAIREQEKMSFFSNKWLLAAMGISIGLQLIVVYTPLNVLFKTAMLGLKEWGIILAVMALGYGLTIAMTKFIVKHVAD